MQLENVFIYKCINVFRIWHAFQVTSTYVIKLAVFFDQAIRGRENANALESLLAGIQLALCGESEI